MYLPDAILEISPDANAQQIREAYKKFASPTKRPPPRELH